MVHGDTTTVQKSSESEREVERIMLKRTDLEYALHPFAAESSSYDPLQAGSR